MTNLRGQRLPPRPSARVLLCVLPAIALQLGCYRYVSADLAAIPVGGHIRAIVSATAADRLHATYGVTGTMLDGRVVARDGDVLTVSVPSVLLGSSLGTHSLYQQVAVAAPDVVGAEVRQLDVFRTGVLFAATAAIGTVIAARALSGATGASGSGTGGGLTESVRGRTVRLAIPLP